MNRLRAAARWLAAIRTATGGLRRHKLQAMVIAAVLLIATASATLGFALLAASNAPFRHAFSAQRGADAAVAVNTAHASPAQLAATTRLPGVTAAAGPFATATVVSQLGGQPFGQLTLAGRPTSGGPVDDVVLSQGHWPDGPGQLVLDSNTGGQGGPLQVGSIVTVTSLHGHPKLTVVGLANSVTSTADGWVTPGEAARLQAPGTPGSAQMLYRFTQAGSYGQVRADVAEVSRALPAGAVAGAASWLSAADAATSNGSIMEPFVVAFALIGLIMAVLIVGNVVSGAVVAGYYRIGVLKSLGLTPGQVVVAYLGRVGWPALGGALAGVVAGQLLALPVLSDSAGVYGVGRQLVPWWASLAAPAGMLALTALAAAGPALRAGRLSAVQAIAAGRAPRAGRGYAAHRLAARLRLPRPAGLGLAAPFARPARTLVSLAAIAFGATAVIFAIGLHSSLSRAEQSQTHSAAAPVIMQGEGGGPKAPQQSTAAQEAAMVAVLRAQPGTAHYVAEYGNLVKVAGLSGQVFAQAYGGDVSWLSFGLISGHWPSGPGQVAVNTAFLTQSGLTVGSPITVNTGTAQATVRIAGEVFAPSSDPRLFASAQTLPGLAVNQNLNQYDVGLKPGTNAAAYMQAVNQALGSGSAWRAYPPQGGQFYTIASALIGLLALMVAVAAGLGVLNTVLMTTRDRLHDLGIYKALGMRPRQLLVMVVCWVAGPAVLAGVLAAPAAVALNSATLRAMAGTAHTGIPASFLQVFPPSRLALLSLAALVIAAAGALLPASWAARARPAVALRTE
ncbi:MAG TPA: FtsX-like permease family protein [Streptosporangiaceae bacterium]|nr:FtsX-like permease family protein [Streptosporangiaceae bacterium]